ncbi:MAG: XRE family transcriptional regulator [Candidatus Cloacimonetes bacterium]|nr:XRE family transcriptional regulator [Candidatus Cloacimonadota bacterium]
MKDYIPINHSLLKWARETAGLTVDDVAKKLNKSVDFVLSIESGSNIITYSLLKKLSYELYKRPIALFFCEFPPIEDPVEKDFRSIYREDDILLDRDTRLKIREAKYHQLSLFELNPEPDPQDKTFSDFLQEISQSKNIVKAVRSKLGISIEEQKKIPTISAAFKIWRSAFEDNGIYVFKGAFKNPNYCGFALYDEIYPIIYVNNRNSITRQTFTLFHELFHLLHKSSSIFCLDESLCYDLNPSQEDVERKCNKFASSVLVPVEDFNKELSIREAQTQNNLERVIEDLAELYSVSRETILRNIKDRGIIDADTYNSFVTNWLKQSLRPKKSSSGGNAIATKISYLSNKYLSIVSERYARGQITSDQLTQYITTKRFDTAEKIYEHYIMGQKR